MVCQKACPISFLSEKQRRGHAGSDAPRNGGGEVDQHERSDGEKHERQQGHGGCGHRIDLVGEQNPEQPTEDDPER